MRDLQTIKSEFLLGQQRLTTYTGFDYGVRNRLETLWHIIAGDRVLDIGLFVFLFSVSCFVEIISSFHDKGNGYGIAFAFVVARSFAPLVRGRGSAHFSASMLDKTERRTRSMLAHWQLFRFYLKFFP